MYVWQDLAVCCVGRSLEYSLSVLLAVSCVYADVFQITEDVIELQDPTEVRGNSHQTVGESSYVLVEVLRSQAGGAGYGACFIAAGKPQASSFQHTG